MISNKDNDDNNNIKILNLIASKDLSKLSEALDMIHTNSNMTNVTSIFESLGEVLVHWSNDGILNYNHRQILRYFFANLDEFVDRYKDNVSCNESLISGLVIFSNYCISKIPCNDDIVDSFSMDNPQCDEALLVLSTIILTKVAVKNVIHTLNHKRLYKEFLKKLSKVIKHGETFASQEYALEIILRICIYESKSKSHTNTNRDIIANLLPSLLSESIKVNNFDGCREVFNDKRSHLNIVNKDNIHVDSFMVTSFYVIKSESKTRGSSIYLDFDTLKKRLLGENVWLDIERRSISITDITYHFSELRSINFGQTQKAMNLIVELRSPAAGSKHEKSEIRNDHGFQVIEYMMLFSNDTNTEDVRTLIKDKLAKTEQESTFMNTKENYQKTIKEPNNNFDDDISECTADTIEDNINVADSHVTPLASNQAKKVSNSRTTKKQVKLPIEPSRIKFGKNAIEAKKKANIVSDLKPKPKVSDIKPDESVQINSRTRSNNVDIPMPPVGNVMENLPAPVKSGRKVKTPINETPDDPVDMMENNDPIEPVKLDREEVKAIQTPVPLVKSKMRLNSQKEIANQKENENQKKTYSQKKITNQKENENQKKIANPKETVDPKLNSKENVDPKESKGNANASSSKENVDPKESKGNANASSSKENVNPKESKGNANASSSKENVNPKESKGNANASSSKENVDPKESKGNTNASSSKENVNPKESKGNTDVSSTMRSVSNEENDELNAFLNVQGSKQKVKRTPLSSPLTSVGSTKKLDPTSSRKALSDIKNTRISLQPNITEGIEDSQDSFMEKETKKVTSSKAEKLRIQKGPLPIAKNNDMTSLARLSKIPTEILEESMDIVDAENIVPDTNIENFDDSYYAEDTFTEYSYKDVEFGNKEPPNYLMEQFSQQSNLSLDKLLYDRGGSQLQDEEVSENERNDTSSSEGEENILSVLVTELTSLKKSKRDKKIRKSLGGAIDNAEIQVDNFLTQWSEYRKSKFSLIEGQIQFNLAKICSTFDEMIDTHSSEISRILTEDRELEDRRQIIQHDCKEFVNEIKKESKSLKEDIHQLQSFLTKRKHALLNELEKEDKMHQTKKPKTQKSIHHSLNKSTKKLVKTSAANI